MQKGNGFQSALFLTPPKVNTNSEHNTPSPAYQARLLNITEEAPRPARAQQPQKRIIQILQSPTPANDQDTEAPRTATSGNSTAPSNMTPTDASPEEFDNTKVHILTSSYNEELNQLISGPGGNSQLVKELLNLIDTTGRTPSPILQKPTYSKAEPGQGATVNNIIINNQIKLQEPAGRFVLNNQVNYNGSVLKNITNLEPFVSQNKTPSQMAGWNKQTWEQYPQNEVCFQQQQSQPFNQEGPFFPPPNLGEPKIFSTESKENFA